MSPIGLPSLRFRIRNALPRQSLLKMGFAFCLPTVDGDVVWRPCSRNMPANSELEMLSAKS